MTRKSEPEHLVTYIRVREIFHPFLQFRYGEFPVNLPEPSSLYPIFTSGLVENHGMKKLCYSTFSQAAYEKKEAQEKEYLPSEADRKKLVPFVMPAYVHCGGKVKPTNRWFQLADKSYQQLTRTIENDFWNAFVAFDQKFRTCCTYQDMKYSQEFSIEKFMLHIGMDAKDEETIIRYWSNKKKSNRRLFDMFRSKESVETLRRQLEQKAMTDDFFCNTFG